MQRVTAGLSYANVVSTVCLFILLGGGAYAATQLPRASVGSAQIKRSAVTSSKVRDRSLLARDFKRGQAPRGAQGPAGPVGPRGYDAREAQFNAFARVSPNGNIDPQRTRQVGQATRVDEGRYCVHTALLLPNNDYGIAPRNAVVTPEDENRTASVRTTFGSTTPADCLGGTLVTLTNTLDSTREDGAFYILFNN